MKSYSTRKNAFTKTQTFVLDAGKLDILTEGGAPRSIPLTDVQQVRLAYDPTRFEPDRFRCEFTTRQNWQWEFFNRSYAGVATFTETTAEYRRFVREFHAQVARANPACRFLAGCSPGQYTFNVACLAFAALMVVGAVIFFWNVGFHALAGVKLLLILAFTPMALGWIRRNRPQPYEPHSIPTNVLPRES